MSQDLPATLRIAIIGALARSYTRHAVIASGLEANRVTVVWHDVPPRTRTPGRILNLLRGFWRCRGCDIILIPAFNQTTAPLAWLLGRVFRVPVLVDYLIGLADTARDRETTAPWLMRVYRAIDRFNINHLPTLTDTPQHRDLFAATLRADVSRMHVLPVGARDAFLAHAHRPPEPRADTPLTVVYLGAYIPFHGVDIILEAARLLQNATPAIEFLLIGRGQLAAEMQALAAGLDNVRFDLRYLKPPELFSALGGARVCLGVFGDGEKTAYVVPSKVFECMALGCAVVTAAAPPVTELFAAGVDLVTVPAGDAPALAAALQALAGDPERCARIAAQGRARIEADYSAAAIGARLLGILAEVRPALTRF
jgi:glycosyltransferase involved in cell wall biosynthesis